jgi:membrane protease subunit (stomatin/prohibitin family)
MNILKKIKGEFIDIVQWLDDTNDTMTYRFERHNNEIKYKAQLVVREGQMAVFINEGQLADVYTPGTYELTTQNMPILSTLKGWKYGFESPFKAEVYFCSTRQFTNLKWGTPGPVTMRDSELGAVRVTAFGIYGIRITDGGTFIKEIVGTDGRFTTDEIADNLRGKIGMRIKQVLPAIGVPVIDLEAQVIEVSSRLKEKLVPFFAEYGLELTEIQVQDVGLPEEVERAIDKRGAIGAIGNMQAYTQYETAGAIEDAAQNEGGMAGGGMGMGMGFAMANQMSNQMAPNPQAQPQATQGPPPLPTTVAYYAAINDQQAGPFDLNAIKQQIAAGSLTRETLVWKQGMAGWVAAAEVPELTVLFAATPPPLPPK